MIRLQNKQQKLVCVCWTISWSFILFNKCLKNLSHSYFEYFNIRLFLGFIFATSISDQFFFKPVISPLTGVVTSDVASCSFLIIQPTNHLQRCYRQFLFLDTDDDFNRAERIYSTYRLKYKFLEPRFDNLTCPLGQPKVFWENVGHTPQWSFDQTVSGQ